MLIVLLFFFDIAIGLVFAHIGIVFLRRIDRSFPRWVCWCGYDLKATEVGTPCPECGVKERRVNSVRRPTSTQRTVASAASAWVPLVPVGIWGLKGVIKDFDNLMFAGVLLVASVAPFLYMIWRAQWYVAPKAYWMILAAPMGVLVLLWGFGLSDIIRTQQISPVQWSLLLYAILAAPGTGLAFLVASAGAWSHLQYQRI